MRLIDADKVLDGVINPYERISISRWLDDAPTVDAVPVVRCGECKHMTATGRCTEFADDHIKPSASDFCVCGERRKDG